MFQNHPAVILGMTETGLGVGRSLSKNGIKTYGFDAQKKIGFYSKYITAKICPHPLKDEKKCLDFLIEFAKKFEYKPVLFITSDYFFNIILNNKKILNEFFLMNLPDNNILKSVSNKYIQYELALKAGIDVPVTFLINNLEKINEIKHQLRYPAFIKAEDVTSWHKVMNKHDRQIKGYVVNNSEELAEKINFILKRGVQSVLVQEVIQGPDTNHFKFCSYVSQNGEFLLVFTLQKIRQHPIRFGIGSIIKSIDYPELEKIGKKFFTNINYRGVGSAEFKLDEKNGKLTLIELNPRYWLQNSLTDKCGLNFPLMDYLETTQQKPQPKYTFKTNIKWINIYMDFSSFLAYRAIGEISLKDWFSSLKGEKIFSDLSYTDIKPFFYNIMKIVKTYSKKFFKNLKF